MNPPTATHNHSIRRQAAMMVCVFLLAFLTRAAFGWATLRERTDAITHQTDSLQFDDERWYWSIAQSYRAGEGMVGEFGHRAERMPLYPWFLSWFSPGEHGLAAARWFQYGLGALAACATMALAWRLSTYGLIAGLVIAFDPTLVGSASLLLSETLTVTILAFLWAVAWPLRDARTASLSRWLATIALAVLAVYAKESTIPIVLALVAYVTFIRNGWSALPGAVATVACLVVALIPWAYRNKQVTGEWIWLTSRGGISLYDGVHPSASGASDLGNIKTDPGVAGLDEAAWNQHFRREAWKHIFDDPIRILGLSVTKLARTWSPILNAADYQSGMIRLIFAVWYIPVYVLVMLGAYHHRKRYKEILGLLIPMLCVCAIHSIFVGSVRYRLVAMPTLAVLVAMGLQAMVHRQSALQDSAKDAA